jgi:hypothetical protein
MKQARVQPSPAKKTRDSEVVEVEDAVVEPDADLLNDIDELLDEIDSVLEDQAVLVAFRQRSGQ